MHSEKFASPIPLHAACGLFENKGIYIVGGRMEDRKTDDPLYIQNWVSTHYFFDLKK
jgi:hypothetical protein